MLLIAPLSIEIFYDDKQSNKILADLEYMNSIDSRPDKERTELMSAFHLLQERILEKAPSRQD